MASVGPGSLCYLAGHVVSESDVLPSSLKGSKRPLEEALTALRKGTLLLKHGRHGKPKVHFFRVGGCDTVLKWRSASGSVKQVRLRTVSEVVAGQTTEVFKRYPLREAACSFSLRYRDDDGSSRTLDLTTADEKQFELWFIGLHVVAARLQALGTPVAPSGPGAGIGLPQPPPGSGGISPADLAQYVSSRLEQVPGPVCISVAERVPYDLLAWGSAQRAPPVAVSMRSVLGVVEECWQRRSQPGLAPGGVALDAYRAAVGRKHAAVITATGALYTWGEGRGGKLGLGHDQDQPQPQRVRHVLEGQCVVAVACGDDCTAALTDGGELFMWGRLHVDSRPQMVPLQVRGDLRGRQVVQVSCGPFHCAAVSSDGQLFTWGEGFGGKLGHGDQSNRAQPTLVVALAGRQVLEVACGVWHSAAIVAEPEGSPYAPLALGVQHHQQQQHSPLKAEGSGVAIDGLIGGDAAGLPPASPPHLPGAVHHHRNNSTSSAFSEASVFHDGVGGSLYTWGGVNESVAFGASEKRDSNKGCLGHGEADLYRGQLLPVRVGGALETRQVRHVAAGSHLTVAVTTGGRVFQMGATGASVPAKHCPWEGATLPELVRGQLQGYFIEEVACGMHHVVAIGRPMDRKQGRPAEQATRTAFAWGRGSEGQLGVRGFDDSAGPLLVEGLKGRHVLQVACGGSNTLAVCEHDMRRWEPDNKEEAEAACKTLFALASEPKQPRSQASGDGDTQGMMRAESRRATDRGTMGGMVRRSFSMMGGTRSGSMSVGSGSGVIAGAPSGGAPDLSRVSSGSARSVHSLGGASAAGSARGGLGSLGSGGAPSFTTHTYSYMASHPRPGIGQQPVQLSLSLPPGKLQRMRSDRTTSSHMSAPTDGSAAGGHRVVSLGSPVKSGGPNGGSYARRSTYGAVTGGHYGSGMSSARSFTAGMGGGMNGAPSYGGRSDLSSLSSWQHRPLSDDDACIAEPEADSGGGALAAVAANRRVSSADLTSPLDDVRSGSSSVVLHEELAEKNRIIERLQWKLEKMQRQQQHHIVPLGTGGDHPSAVGTATVTAGDAEGRAARLLESVKASAGAFREAQLGGSLSPSLSPRQQLQRSDAGGSRAATPLPPSPPRSGGGARHSPLRSTLSPRGLSSVAPLDGAAAEEQATALAAMEALLAKKEAHLEGEQQKLAAWAAELQRREAQLAVQQAQIVGAGGRPVGVTWAVPPVSPASSAAAPDPIPSQSPVLAARVATAFTPASAGVEAYPQAAVAPVAVPQRVAAQAPAQVQQAQPQASPVAHPVAPSSTGSGTQPSSPPAPEEWSEEFEEGVFLTFTSEAGAKKLRRIRFNRSLFTATSAKQWYETNKHRLAQPTGSGTPRVAGSTSTAGGTTVAPSIGSTGASQPGTPSAASTSQHPLGQILEQQANGQVQRAAHGAAPQQAQLQAQQAQQQLPLSPETEALAGLLHYRQSSRNLSFDARELATFNERLQQALAQQQQQQQGQGGPMPGLPPMHRPSRLSRTPAAAAVPSQAAATAPAVVVAPAARAAAIEAVADLPGSPFASAAGRSEQQQEAQGKGNGGAAAGAPASPAPPLVSGELSRDWKSAHSSPLTSDSPLRVASREGSATAAELAGVLRGGAYSASGGSSPIRAAGGSRSGSPLSKTRSVASGSLAKQPSGSLNKQLSGSLSELGTKYTPRAAAAEQQQQQQQQVTGATGEAEPSPSASVGGGSQVTVSPEAASSEGGKRPSSSFSAKISRIRRSITGGGGSSAKKK